MSLDLPYKEREINGTVYKATTLSLVHWAEFSEWLAKIVGSPLADILRGEKVLEKDLSMSDLQYFIGGIVAKVTKDNILSLSEHMGRGLQGGGHILGREQQMTWWPGHMKDLMPVVKLFLEAQYSDFFGGYEGLSQSGSDG